MSRYHGVRDILSLDSPSFFALASMLPAYEGAVLHALRRHKDEPEVDPEELRAQLYTVPTEVPIPAPTPIAEDVPAVETIQPPMIQEGHTLSAEELVAAGPPAPELGQYVGLFEVVKCT
jgi:hypothetical protein